MKKITKKLALMFFASVLLVAATFQTNVSAAENMMNLTLRVEGIDENVYYNTIEVPYTDTLTLQTALSYIDEQEDSLTITGIDTAYITDINGEAAGNFGGWDGWLYKVNGVDAAVGIDGMQLTDGDDIVLYYGDPYGAGMQYPVADTEKIAEGVIRFTSSDTTYDENYNATVTVNPVVGATVTWKSNDTSTSFTTDDNGEIRIEKDLLTPGEHELQISKVNDAGIPLVLRYAPDYTIYIDESDVAADTDSPEDTTSDTVNTDKEEAVQEEAVDGVPKTGDSGYMTAIIMGMAAVGAFAGIIYLKRKGSNENQINNI